MEKEMYEKGNAELLTMFKSKTFEPQNAIRIVAEVSDLNQPILDLDGYSTTYLYEAQAYNNVEAVRFLLENGADPNLCIPELINDCALNDLHFLWDEMQEEVSQRLEIAKLFFAFGADPNLWYEHETLYDHVLWEVFNEFITPHDWEYIKSFFILLIAYGGGGGKSNYPKPSLTETVDKNCINEYDLLLFKCEDGYHLEGHLFNPNGLDIGVV